VTAVAEASYREGSGHLEGSGVPYGLLRDGGYWLAWLSSMFMIFWDDCVMARGYRPVARDQAFLLPPDMREWLPAAHPVWLVITAVADHLDTRALHALRRAGGVGAAGYDPDMLITLLAWAYAHKVTSSRRIEELCRTDIAFRVICAGDAPDHVTIARFRAQLGEAAAAFFTQVLVLCARLGMGRLGLVALDGMKIAASASKSANRTRAGLEKLAADIAAAHAETDAAEDALFGAGVRGDEVPAELADPRTRAKRIAAALADLTAEEAAAEQEAARAARDYLAEPGRPGQPPAAAREAAAQARLESATAGQQAKVEAWQARAASRRAAGGRGQGLPGPAPKAPADCDKVIRARASLEKARAAAEAARTARPDQGSAPVRNLTDPHSRLMPVRGGGFIQGYNTQNVTSQDELIIATELTQDTTDVSWFEPMLRQAQDAAQLITAARPPRPAGDCGIGLFLADAGYLSEHNLTTDGPDRLIATGKRRDLEKQAAGQPGPAWTSPTITAMADRLATTEAITAYRQRGHIAETPHGHLKHNMGFRQLSVRGRPRATAEWLLACAVHNLFKAISTGHLTTTTLAGLT
jgi:transposase